MSNQPSPLSKHRSLTPRQLEIVGLMAVQALSYREIADVLGIATQTVKNHMEVAFQRMNVRDRLALVLIAKEKGWLDDQPELTSLPPRSARPGDKRRAD